MVFTNGLLDPWSAFGILAPPRGADASIRAITIEGGGHHADLMFDHPEDGEGVRRARAEILGEVRRWVGAPAPALSRGGAGGRGGGGGPATAVV